MNTLDRLIDMKEGKTMIIYNNDINYTDIRRILSGCIAMYTKGLISVSETMQQLDKAIEKNTWMIPNIDYRISLQNKLYRYGLNKLSKAIEYMEKH